MSASSARGVSQRHSTVARGVEELPLRSADAHPVSFEYAVARARECSSFGAALQACALAGGLEFDKQVSVPLGFDKAQLSRWQSNSEGIREQRLAQLQAWCGNPIPTLYLVERAGFDAGSLRQRETEIERQNRMLREENAALRRVLIGGGQQ
jgi:hypothetical protein